MNITVCAGFNLTDLHAGAAATYSVNVTYGTLTSTGPEQLLVRTIEAAAVLPNTVATGAVTGDQIRFVDAGMTVITLTSTQLATAAAQANLASAITFVDNLITSAHTASAIVYGGNTYIIESAAAGNGTLTAADGFIELIGSHTLSSTVTTNVFSLAS